MQHKEWQDLIPFYVAQTLSPDDLGRFEAHLIHCEGCQREIDDWRMIASAVWREADNAAQALPPLSAEVYNRLNYRDKAPQRPYPSNPLASQTQAIPDNVRSLPNKRSLVPLTLVAGIVLALVLGGLLLLLALREKRTETTEIALDVTHSLTEQFGVGIAGDDDENTATATVTNTDVGIIPTINLIDEATATYTAGPPIFFTNTPLPSNTLRATVTPPPTDIPNTATIVPNPTQMSSSNGIQIFVDPTATATATFTATPAPIGGGPYITVTAGTFANGLPLCEAFNPTTIPFELYSEADRNSELVGVLQPNDILPIALMSTTGWYLVQLETGVSGWLQANFAYLRGNCVGSLALATALPSATAIIGTSQLSIEAPTSDAVIVINAAYADFYRGPDFSAEVVGVAERNQQFSLIGYQGTGTNRWALIALEDGSQVWIWASVVIEYPVDQAPPTENP